MQPGPRAGGDADALGRAAANMAEWHATSVEALGYASTRWPGAWAATGEYSPIFLNAIVFGGGLSAAEHAERLMALFADRVPTHGLIVLDGTHGLDLVQFGLERAAPKPCFWRTPDPAAAPPMPRQLEILKVTSKELLADFEAVSIEGFGGPPNVARFAVHAPGVLADPRFRLWLGRVDGSSVGAAMAYVGDDVIGIYGVTVVARARGRGYGAALTWQAVQANSRLPATLQPSEMAVRTYQRLGFAPIGHFSVWHQPGPVERARPLQGQR